MKRSVLFLTHASKAPASEWIDALTSAGISVLIADWSLERAVCENAGPAQAALCQIDQEVTTETLTSAIDWVRRERPELPIIACLNENEFRIAKENAFTETSLKRLGFRAVAGVPAQLPTLLRHLEDTFPSAQLLPARSEEDLDLESVQVPKTVRMPDLRTAISLVGALHFATDQKRAGQLALNGIARLVRADNWSLFLTPQTPEADGGTLELLVTRNSRSTLFSGLEPSPIDSTDECIPVLASEVARIAAARMEPLLRIENRSSVLAIPLVTQERVLGVLQGARKRPIFSEAQIALLVALAPSIAAALGNSVRIANAERLSMTDDLTKLNNARYLRHFLVNEIKRARRYGSNVAALFIDLDDFKQVNDAHGHLVGSHVLMEVAAAILPSVRDTDCVIRYGGDEFVVILTETRLDEALQVADRIREKIASRGFTGGRHLKIRLTGSFGVALFPQQALSPQQLITCADRAMYEAKAAGKNCVRIAANSDDKYTDTFPNLNVAVDFQKNPDEELFS